jgi:hypothetical protein
MMTDKTPVHIADYQSLNYGYYYINQQVFRE